MSILKVSTNILTSNTAHLEQIINNLVYKKTLQQIIILTVERPGSAHSQISVKSADATNITDNTEKVSIEIYVL
jgi:hypothetical protein